MERRQRGAARDEHDVVAGLLQTSPEHAANSTSPDDGDAQPPRWGVFATTVLMFFLAEMGDKTQIATVMLAAQYNAWFAVVAGTTLGMMLANAPVVWLGDAITRKISLTLVHRISAVIFSVLGALALWGGPNSDVPAPTPEPKTTANATL